MDFNTAPQRPIAIQEDGRHPHPPQHPPQMSDNQPPPDHAQQHQHQHQHQQDHSMGGGPQGEMKPMKRACNDCRQQKLKCDVVQSPFAPCSRCRKLGKNCTVDTLFKRVGRRDKYSEMQREIEELRWKLRRATQGAGLPIPRPDAAIRSASDTDPNGLRATSNRELGHFTVSGELLDDLYKQYFTLYHPLLPFLDPQQSPDYYFRLSPILGWSIVMVGARRFEREPSLRGTLTADYVRLLWSAISDVPQTYHIVKALCLVCFWPLPTDGLQKDPTSQLTGLMMQIALQNMLHLDYQVQVPFRGELSPVEQRDRLMTWAACNIVAESTSTILGLPSNTVYEGVLGSDFTFLSPYQLPGDLVGQLRVSQFCNTLTKKLYCNNTELNGLVPEPGRQGALEALRGLYARLEMALAEHMTPVTQLHLLAASVHLNAFAFFLPSETQAQIDGLANLYNAVCIFLQGVMNNETSTGTLLNHCSNFIGQTIFSSTFALVKLLNSSFASQVDQERGKALFNGIILAARGMSIERDDLASRVGTRVPLLWRSLGAGAPWTPLKPDPLNLSIQFRMSVSHVYDCHWQWREQLKIKGEAVLAAAAANAPGEGIGTPTSTPGPENGAPQTASNYANLPFAGMDLDSIDLYNSMDWMLGDWSGLPLAPYGYNTIMGA